MSKVSTRGSGDHSGDPSGDESQSSSTLTSRKRRRLAHASQLDICQEIFDGVRAYRSEDGSLCEVFMRLPQKRSNPEYYDSVKQPIDLARIQLKIKSGDYESVDNMGDDIALLVANTKAFYPASTTEFAKAVELQDVFNRERQRVRSIADTCNASTASSVSSKTTRRRGRPRRVPKPEEMDDEDVDSASIAASEDSHIAMSETSTTNLTTCSQRSASGTFDSPYEMLFAAMAKYTGETGRCLADTFTHLPLREALPLYYTVIKEPIDLRTIAQRIQSSSYSSLDDLEKDFMLMSKNAKMFNEPKSLIYQDAATLARILKGKRSEAEHPPVRTNEKRGRRASRLSYNPREVVDEFACIPDGANLIIKTSSEDGSKVKLSRSHTSDVDMAASGTEDEDDDNDDEDDEEEEEEEKGGHHNNQSPANVSATPSSAGSPSPGSPGKQRRGRPPKRPHPTSTTTTTSNRASSRDSSIVTASPPPQPPQPSPPPQPRIVSPKEESPMRTMMTEGQPTSIVTSNMTSGGNSISTDGGSGSGSLPSLIGACSSRYRVGSIRWRVSNVLQTALDARSPSGQLMCTPFLRLPSRKVYPDYYQEIERPIGLMDIKKKLKLNEYTTLESIVSDLDLVFRNAQQYNVEDSSIYRESVILQHVVQKAYQDMLNYQVTPTKRIQSSIINTATPGSPGSGFSDSVSSATVAIGGEMVESTPMKRVRRDVRRVISAEEARTKRLRNVYNSVNNYVAEDGHRPRDLFVLLPSREDYPDYYKVIPEPIDLKTIQLKLETNKYNTHQELVSDLRLMFNNARHFNEEGSGVYNDAVTLERVLKKRLKSLGPYQTTSIQKPDHGLMFPGAQPGDPMGFSPAPGSRMPANVVAPPNTNHLGIKSPLQAPPSVPLLQRCILELFQTIREYSYNGRQLSNLFMRLPTKAEMPTYYEFIKKPVELQTIAKQVVQMRYTDFEEFVADLFLMLDNACRFNEPESQVYTDAVTLHRVCLTKRSMLLTNFASHLGIPPTVPPDVSTGIRRLLTNLHNAMLTACDVDGRGLVDSLIAGDGTETTLTSVTAARLAAIHRAVAAGSFRRLDRLQHDWLRVLKRARCGEGENQPDGSQNPLPSVQQRLDAAELARRWIRLRDEICHRQLRRPVYMPPTSPPQVSSTEAGGALPNHVVILSPAMNFTAVALDRELLKEEETSKLNDYGDDQEEGKPPALVDGETELSELHIRDTLYHTGDFVYVEPPKTSILAVPTLIGRIQRIVQYVGPASTTNAMTTSASADTATSTSADTATVATTAMDTAASSDMATGAAVAVETATAMDTTAPPDIPVEATADKPNAVSVDMATTASSDTAIAAATDTAASADTASDTSKPTITPTDQSEQPPPPPAPEATSEPTATPDADKSKASATSPNEVKYMIHIAWYWRPLEARPSRRRRLLNCELFRTSLVEAIPVSRLMGRCLIMPIALFIRFKPKNIEEKDVFVCESQFSISSQTFVKIRNWTLPNPVGLELEQRPVPFVPTRLPPNEPLENALEQVNASLFTEMNYPLPQTNESVVLQDLTKTEGTIIYEQYVHQNGFLVKLGDFLYVPAAVGSTERHMVRVDKLWKSISQNVILFSGPWFVQPSTIEHLPTRVFYPKEVFLTSAEHATHSLASATGKSYVMRPIDFFQARPTEFPESDMYLCDSKYFEEEKVIRKLKKGLKRTQLSDAAYDDEFYFFPHSIYPRKEASPLLSQASSEPLSQEQLNRPASTALACAIAASNGSTTITPHLVTIPTGARVTGDITGAAMSGSPRTADGGGGEARASPMMSNSPAVTLTEASELSDSDLTGSRKRKFRKPPSGYVLYAGEVRKRLLQDRRNAPFGEISREVGLLWRQMPISQRDVYERKAKLIKVRMEEDEARNKEREREEEKQQLQLQQQQLAASQAMMSHDEKHVMSGIHSLPMGVQSVQPGPHGPTHLPIGTNGPQATAAAPATMQFYQTPTGQVIQIVHAQPTHAGQAQAQHQQVSISQSSFASTPTMSSSAVPTGTQQVVYHLPGQPATMVHATSTSGHSYYHHPHQQTTMAGGQRILVASNTGPGLVGSPAGLQATVQPTQLLLTAPHAAVAHGHGVSTVSTVQHGAPNSGLVTLPGQGLHGTGAPNDGMVTGQMQTHMLQAGHPSMMPPSSMPVATGHGSSAFGVTTHAQPGISSSPGVHAGAPGNVQPSSISGGVHSSVQAPIFVSTPPRTSRVLHSEIYQRYINRLRKNATGGLSDWRNQLSVSSESTPALSATATSQLAGNFLANPQNHAHHQNVTEALWSLRDHLLEDALKIRVRSTNSVECS